MFSKAIMEINSFPSVQQCHDLLQATRHKPDTYSTKYEDFPKCDRCHTSGVICWYFIPEDLETFWLCDCKMGQYFSTLNRQPLAFTSQQIKDNPKYFHEGGRTSYLHTRANIEGVEVPF